MLNIGKVHARLPLTLVESYNELHYFYSPIFVELFVTDEFITVQQALSFLFPVMTAVTRIDHKTHVMRASSRGYCVTAAVAAPHLPQFTITHELRASRFFHKRHE